MIMSINGSLAATNHVAPQALRNVVDNRRVLRRCKSGRGTDILFVQICRTLADIPAVSGGAFGDAHPPKSFEVLQGFGAPSTPDKHSINFPLRTRSFEG
jgi:hypothetical protein